VFRVDRGWRRSRHVNGGGAADDPFGRTDADRIDRDSAPASAYPARTIREHEAGRI
jgi:hypothetical protein